MKTKTPELDKRHELIESGVTNTLTDFYDWLESKGYLICSYVDLGYVEPRLSPIAQRPEQLFADFLGLDLDKIEKERRALLTEIREQA